MVKIDDVAKHAGVSIATVSRVINGSYRISTVKYEKVLKAIDELGYKSSKMQSENNKILIISSLISGEIIQYFEDSASKYNLSTLYKYVSELEVDLDALPNKNDFAGIIILDAHASEDTYEKLKKLCPVVLCRVQYDYNNVISVSVDDEKVAYDVTSYFIKNGRRKIALICDINRSYGPGTANMIHLADRKKLLNGYYLALLDNGIPIDPELVLTADDFSESDNVEKKFRDMLEDPERCPNAVFSSSIAFSIKLSGLAKELGKQIPQEIAFGTCGGMFCGLQLPDIIYGGQPLDRLADITVQTLNSIIKGEIPADKQHNVYIEHTLYGKL